MIEHKIKMSTWYSMIGFGMPDVDYIGSEEGDEFHRVGSLLEFNRSRTGGFEVTTATHTGYVNVTVRSWSDAESIPKVPQDWEDSATGSFESPTGTLVAQNTGGDGDTTPNLINRAGLYGVRVLARGRDIPEVDAGETGPDEYIVDIWPAPGGVTEESFTRSEFGKETESW